jgi:hypothetical protein
MANTPLRLAGPAQLTAAAATKYTVPAATKTVLRHIHVQNPSGAIVNFTMSIGADAAGTRVYDAEPIAANGGVLDQWVYFVLEATEIIQAFASTTAVLVLTLDGDQKTLG